MDKITAWLKQPYRDDMDVIHWILFLGFVALIGTAWASILRMIG